MKKLETLADLEHFVMRAKALVFCSASWVTWLPAYRDQLDTANLPIAELDVDNEAFWGLLRKNFVMNVPAFMLYCDGRFVGVTVGKVDPVELTAITKEPDATE